MEKSYLITAKKIKRGKKRKKERGREKSELLKYLFRRHKYVEMFKVGFLW
jgi:hypothetical protein